MDEDTLLSLSLFGDNGSGSDYDPNGDLFNISAVAGLPLFSGAPISVTSSGGRLAQLAVFSDGTLSFDPTISFNDLAEGATDTIVFQYTIVDEKGFESVAPATVTLTITGQNDAPTLQATVASAVEDGPSVDVDLAVLGADVDTDDDETTLSYTVTGVPTEGTASIGGTALTFDPGADFQNLAEGETRTVVVTVRATDSHGAWAENDISFVVTGTNDAPTIEPAVIHVTEDGPSFDLDLAAIANDIDSDDDGTTLSYRITGASTEGTASISGTTLTFDPGADFQDLADGETRDVAVEVSATDSHGATATSIVTVTVTGTNDAPVVTAIDAGSASEDAAPVVIDLLAGQTDVDNGTVLSATDISVSDDLGNAVAFSDNGDGTITIDPFQYDALNDGENRTLTVNYGVSDGITVTSNTATLVVEGVTDNLPPDAGDDHIAGTIYTYGGAVVLDTLLSNDTDPDLDPLSIGSVLGASALGATVTLNGDGTVSYDPSTIPPFAELTGGATIDDSFTYTVTDGNGGTDTATVMLHISNEDDPPVLNGEIPAQSAFVDLGYSYQLPADLFVDDDEGGPITYSVTLADGSALPSWLTFDAGTRTLTFAANAPGAGDVGIFEVSVIATEEDGQARSTTFDLAVLDGSQINGTPNDDLIIGTIQGDLIFGLGGNDTISGLPGSDVLDGGDGNDSVDGGAGDDVLTGGLGVDTLIGGDGTDSLDGGSGNDNLSGGDGNDTLLGGDGTDTLSDGNGDDYVDAGAGDDQIRINYGNDVLIGGEGNDTFYDSTYNTLTGTKLLDGGAGNDEFSIYNYDGDVDILGGDGADSVSLEFLLGGTYSIDGGAGNDYFGVYNSVNATVILDGGDGDDVIDTRDPYGGVFIISGGDGNDTIHLKQSYRNGGDYTIDAGAGNDLITRAGANGDSSVHLIAGTGADVIQVSAKISDGVYTLGDGLTGDTDQDTLVIQSWDGTATSAIKVTDFDPAHDLLNIDAILNGPITGWDGNANPFGAGFMRLQQDGADTLLQVDLDGGGDNYVTVAILQNTTATDFSEANFFPPYPPDGSAPAGMSLTGTSGDDTLVGGVGPDTLLGLDGNDILQGGPGSDVLDGGDGNDSVDGGAGDDVLTG
ncbi:Ig-like domain-containing protein, partial [Ruegeria sp. 1NDH52C]|nr:Ig-like domain-containing protein [Ruegeria alba]